MGKEPEHFTREDFLRAFFGSFMVGIAFIFKGTMVEYALKMNQYHLIMVLLLTFAMLTFEIYMLGYKYVNDRKSRPFLEFWGKRFFSIIISSFLSILLICYVYGIDKIISSQFGLFKVCVAILLPAATAGGAMEILKK